MHLMVAYADIGLFFVCRWLVVTMDVQWRERDWSQLRDVVANAGPTVRAALATSGLLKFFECLLIWEQEYLLQFLLQMLSPDLHCFLVRGEQIPFTAVEDIYFLTGLPFQGTLLPAEPVLPRGTHLSEIAERYCSGDNYMFGTVVSISGLDSLVHRCIAAMIVRVYGSLATQRISGGQLLVLERVVVGCERFSWGLTLHARMITQLDRCWATGTGEFVFGSILVAWFLERVPMLRPWVLLEAPGAREPRLRRWSAILVRHGGGEGGYYFTVQAVQIWRQMPQIILRYPYAGVDFRRDPDMVLPPGEVFDHRGMLSFVYNLMIYVMF
jgi:hypothetical protein